MNPILTRGISRRVWRQEEPCGTYTPPFGWIPIYFLTWPPGKVFLSAGNVNVNTGHGVPHSGFRRRLGYAAGERRR